MYVSCHSGYGKPDMVHIHAIAVHGFPEARMVSYALILLGLWLLRRCFFIGILTEQQNYRIVSAVIARFYRLGRIISIMGHVSECYIRTPEKYGVTGDGIAIVTNVQSNGGRYGRDFTTI